MTYVPHTKQKKMEQEIFVLIHKEGSLIEKLMSGEVFPFDQLDYFQLQDEISKSVEEIRELAEDKVLEERKRLLETIKTWNKRHFPNEDASWHIQNLLGDYLGWDSDESKEISKMMEKK